MERGEQNQQNPSLHPTPSLVLPTTCFLVEGDLKAKTSDDKSNNRLAFKVRTNKFYHPMTAVSFSTSPLRKCSGIGGPLWAVQDGGRGTWRLLLLWLSQILNQNGGYLIG